MPVATLAAATRICHFGDVGVVTTVLVMMQVVELADASEASLQHLHVKLGSHRLYLIRRHRQRKPVHQSTPAPETVTARTAHLSKACHGTLESMAVEIRRGRNHDFMPLIVGLAGTSCWIAMIRPLWSSSRTSLAQPSGNKALFA